MQVRVMNEGLEVLWVRTETGGLTSLSYRRDGTLEMIISALESALNQARAEAIQVTDEDRSRVASADDVDALLKRDLLVEVRTNQLPDTGRFEERVPFGRGNEPDPVATLPNCYSMPSESCAVHSGLESGNKFLLS